MRIVLTINELDLREAINDINDDKRQSEDPNRLTIKAVKSKLKDPEYLSVLAEELLSNVIEELG